MAKFPLLPPPPASHKTRVPHSAILKPTPASPPIPKKSNLNNSLNVEIVNKSKSLPRGIPAAELKEENNIEELQMECLRLKLEFEELMAVKSELEQRKRSEYKEMEDLREEIATMQTLYQYR